MTLNKKYSLTILTALLLIYGVQFVSFVSAAQIGDRYLRLSDSSAGAVNVTYNLGFYRPDNGVLGSVELEICTNDPFPGTPCTAPVGQDFIASIISSQIGVSGLVVHPSTSPNRLVLSRTPGNVASGLLQINISGIQNPTNSGTYYGRISTFSSDDASGTAIDTGGLAFAINPRYTISTEVPPYLLFCSGVSISGLQCSTASGSYIDVGELSKTNANTATSQFLVGTNAGPGFTITVNGTSPTAGSNVIPALNTQSFSIPGTSQFGINLVYNSSPQIGQDPVGPGLAQPTLEYGISNRFKFTPGDVIAGRNGTSDYRKFTVSYLINVSNSQNPGIYNTSLIYTALATF
jgi:hypothetical protein